MNFTTKYPLWFRLFSAMAVAIVLTCPTITVNAAPPLKGSVYHKKPVVKYIPGPHYYIKALPHGYRTFIYGGMTFYFFNGHFYHHVPQGYTVVTAPVGAVIRFLPPGGVVVTVGAVPYYTLSGVYYQEIEGGYQIVNPPVVVETPSKTFTEEADFVRVTTASLNVRGGPGIDRPIINQVLEGDVLKIQATGPEWYYVKLPDETYGWVMKKYTALLAPKPVG